MGLIQESVSGTDTSKTTDKGPESTEKILARVFELPHNGNGYAMRHPNPTDLSPEKLTRNTDQNKSIL